MPLCVPAGFVFAPAMQQIQNRVAPLGVGPVIRGRINETTPPLFGDFREIPLLCDVTAWHILGSVELGIGRGNLDSAVLPIRPEERHGRGVCHRGAVNINAVVMEAYHQGRRGGAPKTIRAFGHAEPWPDAHSNLLRAGSGNAKHYAIVRIDTRVLGLGNIQRRGPAMPKVVIIVVAMPLTAGSGSPRSIVSRVERSFHGIPMFFSIRSTTLRALTTVASNRDLRHRSVASEFPS